MCTILRACHVDILEYAECELSMLALFRGEINHDTTPTCFYLLCKVALESRNCEKVLRDFVMSIMNTWKYRVMEHSRKKKLDHFYRACPEGASILDVGVAQEIGGAGGKGPAMNLFLKTFRYKPEQYTGLGVEDLSGMDQLYPGKRFVQYPGGRFPFRDKEFDWVFSNAVIEHVGDDNDQVQFVNEMMRVGRKVFFTTPCKYFPVESHTNVFFLHWNNSVFYKWCSKNKPWCNKDTVYLFSTKRLNSIMKQTNARSYLMRKNRLLGMTMTLTILCEQ